MANPAITYEREIVPALFRPWAEVLLDLARPQEGERVLDLACGTGIVARLAARRVGSGGRVTGMDLNPAMLEVAQAQAAQEGLRIEWQQGDATTLPFADGAFDLVLCQHGLQFVPDRTALLKEAHRVLGPQGRIALAVWENLDRHPFWARFNEVLVELIGIPALAAPFCLGDAEQLRMLLQMAGFRDIDLAARSMHAVFGDPQGFVAMEVDVIAAAIPVTQHLNDAARAALTRAAETKLADAIAGQLHHGKISVPMHALLFAARA
ncbi:methyltransferase domain-containing protein [Lysobacter sp. LF1]|uniref:Methyltransferase domain-containing protein n=1 Tax=Lysobacter stagni TaxID=3045172 RepID=A0ABT6XKI6_9GAMM|nr:methyltransferase domain-containing protein [Lysobacter sp. LF1]MDI9240685.1 methyltransferase domain-containing protein [Lysobacter sp. LF1]